MNKVGKTNLNVSRQVFINRETLFLLITLATIAFPSSSVVVNQILGTLTPLFLLLILGNVNAQAFYFALFFITISVGTNFVFGHISYIVFKPILGIVTLLVLFSSERSLSSAFYKRLVKVFAALFLIFLVLHLIDLSEVLFFFRVTSQSDVIHLDRLTAPFLFAGDFGLACLFLAFLSLSIGGRTYFLLGAVFIVLLIFTQSRLALAGIPFSYFFIKGSRYRMIGTTLVMLSSAVLFLYMDNILSHLPYVKRFFDNIDFYMTESKRAEEYIYVANNFWNLFFAGTKNFELTGNLSSAESGIVSYSVKIGILPTFIFWFGLFSIFAMRLKMGFQVFLIVLFYAVFAAPLDRPKLSLIVVLSIAGISSVRKNTDDAEIKCIPC